jgi:hypothetical protein
MTKTLIIFSFTFISWSAFASPTQQICTEAAVKMGRSAYGVEEDCSKVTMGEALCLLGAANSTSRHTFTFSLDECQNISEEAGSCVYEVTTSRHTLIFALSECGAN